MTSESPPKEQGHMGMLSDLAASIGGFAIMGIYILLGIGDIYWLWIAATEVGSFWMFIMGFFPPALVLTAPVGAYALVFDTPLFVFNWFG